MFGSGTLQNEWVTAFERKFGKDFISSVPTSPGVYRFFNATGEVIYVGKAKSLRRRLTQYRDAGRTKRHRKMRLVVKESQRVTFEVHSTDLDACLAETRVIQTLRPKLNVAGAFTFLYPMIGVREFPDHVRFCVTTMPGRFPEYRFFGSFRCRRLTRDAFFSLMRMLDFVGHPLPGKHLKAEREVPYSSVRGFRRLPVGSAEAWERFFRGESREPLEELVLKLLENAGARAKADELQQDLRHLKRFWKREAKALYDAISRMAYEPYPVPQEERDLLFLRYRSEVTR